MDDELCEEVSAGGDDGFPRHQRSDLTDDLLALGEDGRAAGAVDCAIDSATAKQIRVCGVDDGVSCFFCDIGGPVDFDCLATQRKSHCEILHAGDPERVTSFPSALRR